MMKSVLVAGLLASVVSATKGPDISDFDWDTIEPSTSLNYTTCYDEHKCTKLSVPLDWLNTTNPARVTLAIIARPATVPDDDPSHGGSIIVNPGGPSGSGVGFVLRAGHEIQRVVDGNKKYEILSFDPRGVGLTTPRADCFRDEFARGAAKLQDRAVGPLDAGERVVKWQMARSKAFGRLCQEGEGEEVIREFVSTSSVVRDMVEIVDKLDELRKESSSDNTGHEEQQRLELRSSKDDTPRIQYWGFSYGSILGNYFASMYPGRIGRLAVEAIADSTDYAKGLWAINLPDTQKALDHFYETCYDGESRCDLYKHTDKSSQDIRDRVEAFLDDLDASPAPYLWESNVFAITRKDVIEAILGPLYQPQRDFPALATTLASAMDGNFTKLHDGLDTPSPIDSCPLRIPEKYTWGRDAEWAIACGDGDSQTNLTVDGLIDHVNRLKQDSPDFGAIWSALRLACSGWRMRPKYRFTGPWTTPKHDSSLVEGKPAAPLLILSSEIDPVTPLRNAHFLAKGHPGSRVLMQKNVGHGSLFSPGRCRDEYIRAYFETGEMPPEGTICEADCRPFQECPDMPVVALGGAHEEAGRRSPLEMF